MDTPFRDLAEEAQKLKDESAQLLRICRDMEKETRKSWQVDVGREESEKEDAEGA